MNFVRLSNGVTINLPDGVTATLGSTDTPPAPTVTHAAVSFPERALIAPATEIGGSQDATHFGLAAQTRHGHLYNGSHQRRVGILEVDDLLFKYPDQAVLVAAAAGYDGTVRLILPDRSIRNITVNPVQPFPIDYYLWQADGTVARCDQYGQVSTELENMEPYAPGALATGSVTEPAGGTEVPIEQ